MSEEQQQPPKSKAIEEAERISKIFEDTKKQLQSDERFVNYLNKYNDKSVESFIKYYAQQKANWYKHGDGFARFKRSMKTHYYDQALAMFREIYHKKLFNVMCRWVAGEFDLPGIESSFDFQHMASDPNSCSFVEPITPEEFECYWQFRQTGNWIPGSYGVEELDTMDSDYYVSTDHIIHWYHHQRSLYMETSPRDMPPWFSWYDKHFGTVKLLEPPYLRTDLEAQYHEIWEIEIHMKTLTEEQLKGNWFRTLAMRKQQYENPEIAKAWVEEQNRQFYEKQKTEPQYVSVSIYDDQQMGELIPQIETREIDRYYKAIRAWDKRQQWNEQIDMDIIHLKEAKEVIPIQAHDDYRVAINQAYENYSKKTTLECLPHIYETYRQCIAKGEKFDWLNGEIPKKENNFERDCIIKARKWKGEPENFDFLKKENLKFD